MNFPELFHFDRSLLRRGVSLLEPVINIGEQAQNRGLVRQGRCVVMGTAIVIAYLHLFKVSQKFLGMLIKERALRK